VKRLFVPLALAACLASAAAAAGGIAMVSQKKRAFTVASLQIAAGDTVRFTNEDTFIYQIYVHARGLTFESDEQSPGTSVDIRIPTAGTFEVRRQIHPKMLLVVDVR
jgi:plastocyanin